MYIKIYMSELYDEANFYFGYNPTFTKKFKINDVDKYNKLIIEGHLTRQPSWCVSDPRLCKIPLSCMDKDEIKNLYDWLMEHVSHMTFNLPDLPNYSGITLRKKIEYLPEVLELHIQYIRSCIETIELIKV